MPTDPQPPASFADHSQALLAGQRVAFVGRLAGMSRREAAQLVRQRGGIVVEKPDATVHLVVVGDDLLSLSAGASFDAVLDDEVRQAAEGGSLAVIGESDLWARMELIESPHEIRRLYTPAMLADLLGVPVAVIRRWHRRGLIRPVREVRRLPYFDFREVATARRLAELLAAGVSPTAIERQLAALARYLPSVERPLAQLSVIVRGKQILLRQGDGLVEPGGQFRFDFEASDTGDIAALDDETVQVAGYAHAAAEPPGEDASATELGEACLMGGDAEEQAAETAPPEPLVGAPAELARLAAELEEAGQLSEAAEMYRAVLAAAGPAAEICFQLAEILYRLGDHSAARERYYMAVEVDEDFVEARANLGCVLAETGQGELALAAFEGALRYHPDYADVHYHLARTLDEMDRRNEAAEHWHTFLELAPDSPWAAEARTRLAEGG